jgi:hypothetical protein
MRSGTFFFSSLFFLFLYFVFPLFDVPCHDEYTILHTYIYAYKYVHISLSLFVPSSSPSFSPVVLVCVWWVGGGGEREEIFSHFLYNLLTFFFVFVFLLHLYLYAVPPSSYNPLPSLVEDCFLYENQYLRREICFGAYDI